MEQQFYREGLVTGKFAARKRNFFTSDNGYYVAFRILVPGGLGKPELSRDTAGFPDPKTASSRMAGFPRVAQAPQ
jgi:hypothetical protein